MKTKKAKQKTVPMAHKGWFLDQIEKEAMGGHPVDGKLAMAIVWSKGDKPEIR